MDDNLIAPIEGAFSHGEYDVDIQQPKWYARVTWRCPICGRRNSKMFDGKGKFAAAMPLKVRCKVGHDTEVVPYRWNEKVP
jgi:hypothetical protein